jgi:hypothetical protein
LAILDRPLGNLVPQQAPELVDTTPARTAAEEPPSGAAHDKRGGFVRDEAARRLVGGQSKRSRIPGAPDHWHKTLGAAVCFAAYREGQRDVAAVADSPGRPAVTEWAAFRETGHAHAIGRCLLSQLDDDTRRDHPGRRPVRSMTPCPVQDGRSLLRRLTGTGRARPVVQRQEYVPGTICAALPVTAGSTVATRALFRPPRQAGRLLPLTEYAQADVGRLGDALSLSLSGSLSVSGN